MKKFITSLVTALTAVTLFCGQAAFALCSKGEGNSHAEFTKQSIQILNNDKGAAVGNLYNSYKSILLEYCDKPDSDETGYVFAYHFYNPATNKNYLPSNLKASKITAKTKFIEHMKNAASNYKTNKTYSMQELGRAIHFLQDVNVPHHAANLIGGITSHTQYEKYIDQNDSSFFINTSNAYNKFSNYTFENYYTAIFEECAKFAYSMKDTAKSYKSEDWEKAARPTLKLCQQNTASLLYRFEMEVTK